MNANLAKLLARIGENPKAAMALGGGALGAGIGAMGGAAADDDEGMDETGMGAMGGAALGAGAGLAGKQKIMELLKKYYQINVPLMK